MGIRFTRGVVALAAGWLLCTASAMAKEAAGYLTAGEALHITVWAPASPEPDSMAQAADIETFFKTRALLTTPRGVEAAADDVYETTEVAPRFAAALGVLLTERNAPRFLAMVARIQEDSAALMAPVKKPVAEGGRRRPILDYPNYSFCPLAYPPLPQTGSYPSGHAALGWIWGALLAELAPDRADALLARGLDFGESRVICGFHYESDVVAGRLTAAALLQRLHADPDFQRDLKVAKREVDKARKAR